jgi:hypothetical protein
MAQESLNLEGRKQIPMIVRVKELQAGDSLG